MRGPVPVTSRAVIDESTRKAAVVDPVEPRKVLDAAKEHGAEVVAVLTTHGHWDHADGNKELASLVPGVAVYGRKGE